MFSPLKKEWVETAHGPFVGKEDAEAAGKEAIKFSQWRVIEKVTRSWPDRDNEETVNFLTPIFNKRKEN